MCTQLSVVGTADSVLIREVFLIQSILYPLYSIHTVLLLLISKQNCILERKVKMFSPTTCVFLEIDCVRCMCVRTCCAVLCTGLCHSGEFPSFHLFFECVTKVTQKVIDVVGSLFN